MALVPEHMVVELTVTSGSWLTVTVTVVVAMTPQPDALPLTVKTLLLVGFTLRVEVFNPEFHVYVVTPVAISVAEFPEQIVGELTLILGELVTKTPVVAVLTQPCEEVPVIVNVRFVVGVTTIELLMLALLQV